MKGFVPVTKASLLVMCEECFEEIEKEYHKKYRKRVDLYISEEKQRISTRRWYRLWMLPKARFDIDSLESIENYSANRYYETFDSCPLKSLEKDMKNSVKWVSSLVGIANSRHSGEPIQLDIETFERISSPPTFHWVNVGMFYTLR
jgi:hypothetical protein